MPETPDLSREPSKDEDGAIASEVYTLLAGVIGGAEVLRAKFGADVNVEQINRAARRLLVLAQPIIRGASAPKVAAAASPAARVLTADATSKNRKRRTILHIEDNEQVARTVERLLERRTMIKVLHAVTGEAGLQMARVYHPETILLDLDLPDLHGSEVLKQLSTHPETRAIPVIIVSGDHNSMVIENLLAAGARNYLTKPIDAKRLLLALDALLGAT